MFGTMHRDQMRLVRDELAQLRQLNQDLHALQAGLTTRAPAATVPTSPAPGDTHLPESLARIEALLLSLEPRLEVTPTEDGGPVRPAHTGLGPEGGSSSSPSPPDEGEHGTIEHGEIGTRRLAPEDHRAGPTPVRADDPDATRIGRQTGEEIHTLLHRRIAEIQKERQGRWQRIMTLLLGQ
jgi:hypothetical protein